MKKKNIVFFIIILLFVVIVLILLFIKFTNNQYSEFLVDNAQPVAELNGEISFTKASQISTGTNWNDFVLNYPISAIKKKDGLYYTTLNVIDFGKIYVFLDKELTVLETNFMIDKTKDDFELLVVGQSTFADVSSIDKSTIKIMGNLNLSIHWLSDGSILVIKYSPHNNIIKSIEFSENNWHNSFHSVDW